MTVLLLWQFLSPGTRFSVLLSKKTTLLTTAYRKRGAKSDTQLNLMCPSSITSNSAKKASPWPLVPDDLDQSLRLGPLTSYFHHGESPYPF